jgi:hypothetical protein
MSERAQHRVTHILPPCVVVSVACAEAASSDGREFCTLVRYGDETEQPVRCIIHSKWLSGHEGELNHRSRSVLSTGRAKLHSIEAAREGNLKSGPDLIDASLHCTQRGEHTVCPLMEGRISAHSRPPKRREQPCQRTVAVLRRYSSTSNDNSRCGVVGCTVGIGMRCISCKR